MAPKWEIPGRKVELVVGETQLELEDTRRGVTYDEDGDVVMSG